MSKNGGMFGLFITYIGLHVYRQFFFLILPLAPGTKLYGTLRFNPVPYPRLNRGEKTRQDVVLWGVVAFIYHTGTITGVIANLLSNKK